MLYEGTPNLENFKQFRAEQTDKILLGTQTHTDTQIKDVLVPSSTTELMLADTLIQPNTLIQSDTLIQPPPVQPVIIAIGATPPKNAASFETKINQTTPADENKNTEHTVYEDSDRTAAPPDDEITVEVGPIFDESAQPPCTEILAPPEVIVLAPPELICEKIIISDDDFRFTEVLSNSDTSKQTSLAPPSAREVLSQNIEKLTSVKGRIGKRLFRCEYVNDSKIPE